MQWTVLLTLAFAAQNVQALLRFSCAQLVTQRLDPLVTPGEVSPHLHQIVGGNAFNVTMDPGLDLPKLATCTTCTFTEDLSNYWTAVLFYKHPNGTFKKVSQIPGPYLGGKGGMTVYYMQGISFGALSRASTDKLTAFKKGFRMLVGDAMVRTFDRNNAEAKALTFRCLGANWNLGTATNNLPLKPCAGGIRAEVMFPTCWDGKNLDSPDHKAHVSFQVGGKCPATHPVLLPQLFFETNWDTREFNSAFPSDGTQPFVMSMGDPDGYGQHADYVFGWKDDSLQKAMDSCKSTAGDACRGTLTSQSEAGINACTQKQRVVENVDGWLKALPGCNPVQGGPGRATPVTGCGAPSTLSN